MSVLTAKLNDIARTIALVTTEDIFPISNALIDSAGKSVIAVGSGGSAIAARYLACCRADITDHPTLVQTPYEFVFGDEHLHGYQVWVFSGKGENHDAKSALGAAIARGCKDVHFVTSNPQSPFIYAFSPKGVRAHVVQVADVKDGFLATHSLFAALTSLLLAIDRAVGTDRFQDRKADLISAISRKRSTSEMDRVRNLYGSIAETDTMILVHEPRLAAAAEALQTSIWETGLCPIQVTDLRNLAHGRHAWVHRRALSTVLVGMLDIKTERLWTTFIEKFPNSLRSSASFYKGVGRLEQYISIFDAMMIVEAIGAAVNIDPGKPALSESARAIYDDPWLAKVGEDLSSPVRHKIRAVRQQDQTFSYPDISAQSYGAYRRALGEAQFSAMALDYDGTIVTTEGRLNPPDEAIINELKRLLDGGFRLGIASGRGGSVGERLREILPRQYHSGIVMGYYNGSYVTHLDIDIRDQPAPISPEISEFRAWLEEKRPELTPQIKDHGPQLTITMKSLTDRLKLIEEIRPAPLIIDGSLKIVQSGHSIDIVSASSSKTSVLTTLGGEMNHVTSSILCVGDSGGRLGNDHDLLGGHHGVSVGEVCDRPETCWTLFDSTVFGPTALLRILTALKPLDNGLFALDLSDIQN